MRVYGIHEARVVEAINLHSRIFYYSWTTSKNPSYQILKYIRREKKTFPISLGIAATRRSSFFISKF